MIKSYSTIILDLFGVVISQNRKTLLDFAKIKNQGLDIEKAENLFQKAINGEIEENEFLANLGLNEKDLNTFIQTKLSLNDGFIDFAKALGSKYNMALMTNNTCKFTEMILEHFGIKKYFKYIFVSSEMKAAKPKFEILDKAMEIMKTSPSECIFIDNREKNLLSAEEVGLAPILFEGNNERYYGASVYTFKELGCFIG